jgi:hypothetical protein
MSYIPESLRKLIIERAEGHCEYCRIHMNVAYLAHQIDHIYAEKHGGETSEDNLCLSCILCNRYKGSDLCSLDPQTGEISELFHPRREKWETHFKLEGERIVPLTAQGRVTVKLLQLNSEERLLERTLLIEQGRYP